MKIEKRLKSLLSGFQQDLAGLALVAAKELEAVMKRRIFQDGKAQNGQQIGKYSTKPIYVNPNKPKKGLPKSKLSKLKPRGKDPKSGTRFKNGKPRKTHYLDKGYSGLRRVFGRQNSKVDLNLTGSLRLSIKTVSRRSAAAVVFTDAADQAKARGNERRFRKRIFSPSLSEKELVFRTIRNQIRQAINKK